MAKAISLGDKIYDEAFIMSRAMNRSVAGQVEYWAKIGKIAEDNQDLTYQSIKDILIGLKQVEMSDISEYIFDSDDE